MRSTWSRTTKIPGRTKLKAGENYLRPPFQFAITFERNICLTYFFLIIWDILLSFKNNEFLNENIPHWPDSYDVIISEKCHQNTPKTYRIGYLSPIIDSLTWKLVWFRFFGEERRWKHQTWKVWHFRVTLPHLGSKPGAHTQI